MKKSLKKIAFEALIQEMHIKSLRSGDKGARITLELDNPSDTLLSKLNELHKADRFVAVAIAEIKE